MQATTKTTTHFFTVDVEEYFQVRALESVVSRDEWLSRPTRVAGSIDQLLTSLDRYGTRGTFFALGWLAEHRPEVIRAISSAGHEVASHGFRHERVTSLTPAQFREDLRSSREALEQVTGSRVLGYRAPNFSIVPGFEWAFDALIEEGYVYDSSLFPIHRSGYGYPSAPRVPHLIRRPCGELAEFPLATISVLSYPIPAAGGGYLRQFPFGLIRRAFRQAADRGEPATFYIHPWEIDDAQPRLPVSSLNRIRHYRGLDTALHRIERLLGEFKFTTIASYLPQLEPSLAGRTTVGAA